MGQGAKYRDVYVIGSSAPQLQPRRDRKQEQLIRSKMKRKAATRARNQFINNLKMGLLLFIPCLLFLTAYASISESHRQIKDFQNKISQVKLENQKIRMSVANSTSPEAIKQIAITKLGMQEPQPYQIIEIRVPKTDYTVTKRSVENLTE